MSITVRFFERANAGRNLVPPDIGAAPAVADHDDVAGVPARLADTLFVGLADFDPLLDLAGQAARCQGQWSGKSKTNKDCLLQR
jgi:hypothetical protein